MMGRRGRERVEQVLAWPIQAPAYVSVYQSLTGFHGEPVAATTAQQPSRSPTSRSSPPG